MPVLVRTHHVFGRDVVEAVGRQEARFEACIEAVMGGIPPAKAAFMPPAWFGIRPADGRDQQNEERDGEDAKASNTGSLGEAVSDDS